MSVDSLRIEDIFRGTEAEVVNHFANKNKTIQQLQAAVGTLAVSTDTNRVMIFTGPTTSGTHSRGDFSWNTFSTKTTYTLDDSVVAQYNPLMWFDAGHVSSEYLGGGEGLLRDAIRSYDISEINTVRPVNIDPAFGSNGGVVNNFGDWHVQSFHASSWNSYPGGVGFQYGIKVNSDKFFRAHNDMSMWMSVVTGQDHGISQTAGYDSGFYFDPNGSNPTKIEDRAAVVPAGYKVATTTSTFLSNWNNVTHGKIVHRDGHKYLRTGTATNAGGPSPDCSFLAESGQTYPFGATCFQIIRKAPAYNGPSVPLCSKARYSNAQMEMKSNGNATTMGAAAAGSFNENHGQTHSTWRNFSYNSTANNHFYYQKSTGNRSSNFAGHSYVPAWGFYPSKRAYIHDTSVGGGANVGTVTYDYNTFKAELASNLFSNLEGNIVEIDNNNMPDHIIVGHGDGTATYVGSTTPYDWHLLASGNKPIGWQTFYMPKWDDPQMRVFPYGAGSAQAGTFQEERVNGFGQTKFRNDYQGYMFRPSVDAGTGTDGSGYSANTRNTGKHMFDQNKDSGLLWELGNVHSTYASRLGQSVTTSQSSSHNFAVDVAETIIVPTPGSYSAYVTMVANIEGYLAAKYGIQQDCSLNVPA
tara:strand:+ start:1577 stop:3487 length:1911 start_codon:yes stop_codon:yes gene_type:complete